MCDTSVTMGSYLENPQSKAKRNLYFCWNIFRGVQSIFRGISKAAHFFSVLNTQQCLVHLHCIRVAAKLYKKVLSKFVGNKAKRVDKPTVHHQKKTPKNRKCFYFV